MLIKKQTVFTKCEGNPWEFHHTSVEADIGKRKIRNAVRKTCTERRKISLLKDLKMRKRFKEKVIELVDIGSLNLSRHFKEGMLKVCDEESVKRQGEIPRRYI